MIDMERIRKYAGSREFLRALDIPEDRAPMIFTLGQGEYNANYLFTHPVTGKRLVLRINLGSQMHLEDQIGYEFSALRDLESSGRTPKPLFCDGSKTAIPWGALVMEWLPGRPLRYETDLDEAAGIFADIHTTPVPPDTRLICPERPAYAIYEECLEMAEHYFTWPRADCGSRRLLEALIGETGRLPLEREAAGTRCIVNTEVNSGNFLINDGGTGYLVDWEKPLLSEPAQDLGHFLAPTTTFWKTDTLLTPEEIRRFTAAYMEKVRGRMEPDALWERLPLFFAVTCLRGVTWCAMARREYARPDRPLVNADTLVKLDAYLSPDFLENILNNYIRRAFLRGSGRI